MRRTFVLLLALSPWSVGIVAGEGATERPFTTADYDVFEKSVRPLLARRCFRCHSARADELESGLRLDSREGVLRGGDRGPAAVAGRPEESLLVRAVRYASELQMPPNRKLPEEEIEVLTRWVRAGLPWPTTRPETPEDESREAESTHEDRESHWAFRPIRRPDLPPLGRDDRHRRPIDRFVLARLQAAGLEPSPRADAVTLIRRATFDLTGLPPTPEEVEDFVRDRSPDAFRKLVDRLLASPRYGERWGRHWLDVARYADTKGYAFQRERRYPFSYTYRDYVVRSLNDDVPYDRFILEQIAADLLPDVAGDDGRTLAGLGFLTVGRKFNQRNLDVDDQIDVVTRGLMGLTAACARCHDHKYDDIPTEDYYSLYGVFESSREPDELPLIGDPEESPGYETYRREREKLLEAMREFLEKKLPEYAGRKGVPADITADELPRHFNRADRDAYRELERKVQKHQVESESAPPRAMILVDLPEPRNAHVFVRGNPRRLGKEVPRQFLGLLAGEDRKPFSKGSGRLELARAIVDPKNPLTARVLVNRVWMHHFGEPLVATPSDFGVRSDPPSQPEVLDYLAWFFRANDWSVKELHREIMLSATYQQASVDRPDGSAVDPENRLLWRMNRRRLEFEALRDSVLAVSARLDGAIGGRPLNQLADPRSRRRTIYSFIDRQDLPGLLRVFDFANPDQSSARRPRTTVPQQALFLMNSAFMREQAKALAARLEKTSEESGASRIEALYRVVLSRSPTESEIGSSLRFVREAASPASDREDGMSPLAQLAQVLLLTNEFLFVD